MSDVKKQASMLVKYNSVFDSGQGRMVLGDIAKLCRVFDLSAPLTPEQAAVRKIGLIILARAGLTMDASKSIISAVMDNAKDHDLEQITAYIEKHSGQSTGGK